MSGRHQEQLDLHIPLNCRQKSYYAPVYRANASPPRIVMAISTSNLQQERHVGWTPARADLLEEDTNRSQ